MLKIHEHLLCNGSSIIFKVLSCDIHEALTMFPHSVQTDAQSGRSFSPEAGRISECWVSYTTNAWLSMLTMHFMKARLTTMILALYNPTSGGS